MDPSAPHLLDLVVDPFRNAARLLAIVPAVLFLNGLYLFLQSPLQVFLAISQGLVEDLKIDH